MVAGLFVRDNWLHQEWMARIAGEREGGRTSFRRGAKFPALEMVMLLRIEKARRACCFSLRPSPILRVDPPTDLLVTQRFCVTHAARELSHRLINAPGCCWDAMGQCRTRCSRFNYAECWLLVTDTGIMTRLERDHMYVRCKW